MIKIYNDRMIHMDSRGKKSRIPTDKFLKYLDEPVELDKKTTFGTIISLLYLNKDITNYIFGRTLGGVDIEEFFQDMNTPPDVDQKNDYKTEYLEIHQYPDIWKYEKKEKRFDYTNVLSLHIIKHEENEDVPYGISFVKLSNLKKHVIRINLEYDFLINDTTKKFTKESLIPILETKLEIIRLYDFLGAILYEISWHGTPSDRDSFSEELVNRVKDIEEGNVELISWDEAMKRLGNKKTKKPRRKKK